MFHTGYCSWRTALCQRAAGEVSLPNVGLWVLLRRKMIRSHTFETDLKPLLSLLSPQVRFSLAHFRLTNTVWVLMQQTEHIKQKGFSHPFKAATVSDLTMWQHQFSVLRDQYCDGLCILERLCHSPWVVFSHIWSTASLHNYTAARSGDQALLWIICETQRTRDISYTGKKWSVPTRIL